jgi:hypothetical protein
MEKLKQEEAKRTALTKAKIEAAKARVEAQLQGKPVVEVKTEPAEPEINLDVRPAIHLNLLLRGIRILVRMGSYSAVLQIGSLIRDPVPF